MIGVHESAVDMAFGEGLPAIGELVAVGVALGCVLAWRRRHA